MDIQAIKSTIENGNAVLGIEMGSTRIKAVLIDEKHNPVASGSHGWENRFENGVWTYHLDDVWAGLQDAYKNLNLYRERAPANPCRFSGRDRAVYRY